MDSFLQQSRTAFRSLFGLETASAAADAGLFGLARRNRVLGLWADAPLPDPWSRAVFGQAMYTARLSEEASRIVRALGDSVPNLRLVKGPALAWQAWPREGLRSFDDLDFRCAQRALPALVDGLSALGYAVTADSDARRDALWQFGWGIEFRHPDGFMVEANHRMFPPHFPWPERRLDSALWSSMELGGVGVVCPAPALHLLLACAHAAWHGWERLGWLVDIAGLLVRHPGVLTDAQQLVRRGGFADKALQCGCTIATTILGPLPGVVASGAFEHLVTQALEILVRTEPEVLVSVQRGIHQRLMSLSERRMYLLRRLSTPGDPDFTALPLPGSLRGLYWALRPVRGLVGRIRALGT